MSMVILVVYVRFSLTYTQYLCKIVVMRRQSRSCVACLLMPGHVIMRLYVSAITSFAGKRCHKKNVMESVAVP